MKKIIASMLIFALLALGLVGCGGGTSSSAPAGSSSAAGSSSDVSASGSTGGDANADWAYIEAKGELIIGITYFEPMNYLDDSGALTGFETEFATAVCEILGVTPVFQEINWQAKETELNAKNIDCIWNGMTINADREANMSICQPYMQNKQVLIVKAENAEAYGASVDGLSVVAEAGSAGETVAQEEEFFANATYTPVDTQAKALIEVAAGTADACVVDYVLSIGMIGEGTDFEGLIAVDERGFGEEEYGVALRKTDTELTQKINDAINQLLQDGTLMAIAEKYKLGELLLGA